jgi:choline dehydrogenase
VTSFKHDVHELALARTSSVICLPSVLHPKGRGTVTLRSSNPLDPPVISYELLGHPEDRRILTEACRMVRRIFEMEPLRSFVTSEELPGSDVQTDEDWAETLANFTFGGNHAVGTCKMGVTDDAVVDPQLRVRGVRGLRVVDASIMPEVVSGNTNAASIMIGERGADLVLGSDTAASSSVSQGRQAD